MAQDDGKRFEIHAVLDRSGGEGVAEAMEVQVADAEGLEHALVDVAAGPGGDPGSVGLGANVLAL